MDVRSIEGRVPHKCKRNYCQSLSFSVTTYVVISRTIWKPLLSKKGDSIEGEKNPCKSTMIMSRFKGTGETLSFILYLPNHLLSYQHVKDRAKSVEKAVNDIKFLLLRNNNTTITSFQYLSIFCCSAVFVLKNMSRLYRLKNENLSFEFVLLTAEFSICNCIQWCI